MRVTAHSVGLRSSAAVSCGCCTSALHRRLPLGMLNSFCLKTGPLRLLLFVYLAIKINGYERAKTWTNRINAGTAENVEVDSERRIFAGCRKQATASAPSWRRNLISLRFASCTLAEISGVHSFETVLNFQGAFLERCILPPYKMMSQR